MTHTYTKKGSVLYRYYVCVNAHQRGWNTCPTRSVSAPEIEAAVLRRIRGIANQPELQVRIIQKLSEQASDERLSATSASHVIQRPAGIHVPDLLKDFDLLWQAMTVREQEKFVKAIVEQVEYDGPHGTVKIAFRYREFLRLAECEDVINGCERWVRSGV